MAPAAPATAPRRAPAERAGTAAPSRTGPARRKSGAVASAAPATRRKPATARPARTRAETRPRATPTVRPVARALASAGMPLIDRVLRGPAWVVMLGALLAGIVFLNVSVLELNRGIAQTDAKAAALERVNSGLRARVAKLDSGERIQELAAARGYVMPQPGDVTFVKTRSSDAKLAAQRMVTPTATPAPVTPAPVTPAPVTPAPVTPAPVAPTATPAPVTQAPATTATTTTTQVP